MNRAALHGEKSGDRNNPGCEILPIFARRLSRIYKENIPNQFDIERVKGYYAQYPAGIVAAIEKENTPTITAKLDRRLLEQNYDEVLRIAGEVPSAEALTETLRAIGGIPAITISI